MNIWLTKFIISLLARLLRQRIRRNARTARQESLLSDIKAHLALGSSLIVQEGIQTSVSLKSVERGEKSMMQLLPYGWDYSRLP